MTMLSFRVDETQAAEAQRWATHLRLDRSELLRQALHAYLTRLAAEDDAAIWEHRPLSAEEGALGELADWGPAEDWSDWSDAPG
jgi:predicted transcriptional regulator